MTGDDGIDAAEIFWEGVDNGIAMRRSIERHVIPDGISRGEYGLLGAARILGPRPLNVLAKRLLKISSNITYLLDKLIDRGYAVKVKSPDDGRSFNVELTPDGVEMADRMIAGRDRMASYFLSDLDASDKDDLSVIVIKMKMRIDELQSVHPEALGAGDLEDIREESGRLPDRYELRLRRNGYLV